MAWVARCFDLQYQVFDELAGLLGCRADSLGAVEHVAARIRSERPLEDCIHVAVPKLSDPPPPLVTIHSRDPPVVLGFTPYFGP
jgi:hypothetical protein